MGSRSQTATGGNTAEVGSDTLPVLTFGSAADWDAWLAGNHATAAGAWLKIAKAGAPEGTVSYSDAVDVALCHGWIDGQKGRFDEAYWLQRFTPRKPGSKWSKLNTERARRLLETGRMRAAGLREVDLARADGRWDAAYEPQSRAEVPADLAAALAANPAAQAFFDTLDRVNRYAVIYRVTSVKRPETRAKKIAGFVVMLSEQRKIHP